MGKGSGNRIEIGSKSDQNRIKIGSKSDQNRIKIGSTSDQNRIEIGSKSDHRIKIGLKSDQKSKSDRNRIEVGSKSDRNRIESDRNRIKIGSKSDHDLDPDPLFCRRDSPPPSPKCACNTFPCQNSLPPPPKAGLFSQVNPGREPAVRELHSHATCFCVLFHWLCLCTLWVR